MSRCAMVLCALLALHAPLGCGGSCDRPHEVGAPFGHTGTASVSGVATHPDVGDGMGLQFLLVDGGLRVGVIPDNILDPSSSQFTCGTEIDFEIQRVEPGTYGVALLLRDPDVDPTGGADIVYDGTATQSVTVVDGQVLVANLTFP